MNDAERLVALVRGMPAVDLKALLVDWGTDLEVIQLVCHNPRVERRLTDMVYNAKPKCEKCGWRHWPGDDPDCDPTSSPGQEVEP